MDFLLVSSLSPYILLLYTILLSLFLSFYLSLSLWGVGNKERKRKKCKIFYISFLTFTDH